MEVPDIDVGFVACRHAKINFERYFFLNGPPANVSSK